MEMTWSNGKKIVVTIVAIVVFTAIFAACFIGLQGVN